MHISTEAIVLHFARLSDKTSVLHLYTREFGRVAYYLYGATSKRNPKNALLIPLTWLEIEAVHLENRDIQQLKDWRIAYVASATAEDICRQTVSLFIAEMLYRTLQHPLADEVVFDLICTTIEALNTREDPENVHLEFLYQFIDSLGFGIDMQLPQNSDFIPLVSHQPMGQIQRRNLLKKFMTYYSEHIPNFTPPKSLDVMIEVFS